MCSTPRRRCRRSAPRSSGAARGAWLVRGVGVGGFAEPAAALDFGNSGTGCRLMLGAVAGCPITATFDGDASLRQRPMRRVLDPLERIGARTLAVDRRPVAADACRRARADPDRVRAAGSLGAAEIGGSARRACGAGRDHRDRGEATRDHTEKMLTHFGADVRVEPHGDRGRRITLAGQPELVPRPIVVPADPSSAAFPLVAALIAPGSEIILEGVMINPLRTGLIATLRRDGRLDRAAGERNEGGEEVADLRVRASALRGVEVPAARAPSMIDEYPVLAVAAAFAEGTTVMRGLEGVARQGIRSPRRHRRAAARQRGRRSRSKATISSCRAGAARQAAASSPPIWTTASPCRRWSWAWRARSR